MDPTAQSRRAVLCQGDVTRLHVSSSRRLRRSQNVPRAPPTTEPAQAPQLDQRGQRPPRCFPRDPTSLHESLSPHPAAGDASRSASAWYRLSVAVVAGLARRAARPAPPTLRRSAGSLTSSGRTSPRRRSVMARCTTLSSSRTFPGQWSASSNASASRVKPSTASWSSWLHRTRKCSTSSGMSSRRARSAGTSRIAAPQAIVEVLAELAQLDRRLEIAMGRRDHAHVHAHRCAWRPRPGLPRPGGSAAACSGPRGAARRSRPGTAVPPSSRGEEPLLLPDGAGERAALVPEELAPQEVRREVGAVDDLGTLARAARSGAGWRRRRVPCRSPTRPGSGPGGWTGRRPPSRRKSACIAALRPMIPWKEGRSAPAIRAQLRRPPVVTPADRETPSLTRGSP